MSEQYDRAHKMLADNKELLQRVAEALLEYEMLDAEQLKTLIEGRKLAPREPAAAPPPPVTPAREGKVDDGERTGGLMPPLPTPKPTTS